MIEKREMKQMTNTGRLITLCNKNIRSMRNTLKNA